MSNLILGELLLLAFAAAIFIWGIRSGRQLDGATVAQAQSQFYRQRRAEISAEFEQGLIDETQRGDLEMELDRQVLEEAPTAAAVANSATGFPFWVAGFGVLLIVSAIWLYGYLGYRDDLQLQALQADIVAAGQSGAEMSPEAINAYQQQLQKIIDKHPDSADHLVVMTGLLRQRGDFAGSIPYFEKLRELYPKDPDIMAQLGQARYLASNRTLDATTQALFDQALQIEPNQATALGVLGIDAFARGDFRGVLQYWQPLMMGLPPGTQQFNLIASGIQQARERAVAAGELKGISIAINYSEAALATPGILFVVAKEPDGMPMPVAALKLPVMGNGQQVILLDSDIIRPGKQFKDFSELSISAHISTTGVANRRSGEWLAEPVSWESDTSLPLSLQIDTQLP
ncbi:c-type cytochrome biogenesis protein CcmI [Spongiibacter sp. KMU-158]|uniref:C-type cytochrome biogenesis protein CcmI n=1 Tax=Spongiibacter pelagi TaxID=2760804 RepID=A0A927C3N8_9GAMM|nr:c-type cytochrome biogenesis protein CcmI [Spongiibacter pelagi]MBD2859031.1 c-type cytochrome biogenesis protein CcmI [Spongiibacter pelagi]